MLRQHDFRCFACACEPGTDRYIKCDVGERDTSRCCLISTLFGQSGARRIFRADNLLRRIVYKPVSHEVNPAASGGAGQCHHVHTSNRHDVLPTRQLFSSQGQASD